MNHKHAALELSKGLKIV